jgi:hypothetical protein
MKTTMLKQTIQRIIEIPLDEIQTPETAEIWAKQGENVCICCGKKIKDKSKAKSVHLTTNGTIISYGGTDIENSQGFFSVGNECAKKLIISFTF